MSMDAAGTATIRLTRATSTSSTPSPSATTAPAFKGLDLFPVDTPPSSGFILDGIENNAFEFHPSKRSLSSRQVYVMLYNIQNRLGLMKGMDGGWSITASKQMLEMLKKSKNRNKQPASSSSAPLAITDKDLRTKRKKRTRTRRLSKPSPTTHRMMVRAAGAIPARTRQVRMTAA